MEPTEKTVQEYGMLAQVQINEIKAAYTALSNVAKIGKQLEKISDSWIESDWDIFVNEIWYTYRPVTSDEVELPEYQIFKGNLPEAYLRIFRSLGKGYSR